MVRRPPTRTWPRSGEQPEQRGVAGDQRAAERLPGVEGLPGDDLAAAGHPGRGDDDAGTAPHLRRVAVTAQLLGLLQRGLAVRARGRGLVVQRPVVFSLGARLAWLILVGDHGQRHELRARRQQRAEPDVAFEQPQELGRGRGEPGAGAPWRAIHAAANAPRTTVPGR